MDQERQELHDRLRGLVSNGILKFDQILGNTFVAEMDRMFVLIEWLQDDKPTLLIGKPAERKLYEEKGYHLKKLFEFVRENHQKNKEKPIPPPVETIGDINLTAAEAIRLLP